jgi:hypothetical protein
MVAQEVIKLSVNEVFPSITDDDVRHSKSRKNYIVEEALNCIGIDLFTGNCLYLLGHVVYRYQNVPFEDGNGPMKLIS